MDTSKNVTIYEVGPRDGLQNEKQVVSTTDKITFIKKLIKAGCQNIEVGSFVRPDLLPQMSDTAELLTELNKTYKNDPVQFISLVPNLKGLELALKCDLKAIAVFTAASESFNKKNVNMSIEESLEHIQKICAEAKKNNLWNRAYVSTAFGCPYEGAISSGRVAEVCDKLLQFGADQVVLGDTNGVASPSLVREVISKVQKVVPIEKLGLHFHDTYAMAILNTHVGLEMGVRHFDSSAGGLGGCPYANGASGNMATEDLLHLLDSESYCSSLRMADLAEASSYIFKVLGKTSSSKNVQRHLK